MKAVIPAAGLGIRFLPYTKAQPKEMIPIVDKPAIQYVVEEAVAGDMRDILIVTGRGKRAIEDHFDANVELEDHLARTGRSKALDELRQLMQQTRIMYVRQASPRGLGDAVLCAEPFVNDEPFAVLLGDDLTLNPPCAQALATAFRRLGGTILALQEVPPDQIGRYGVVAGKTLEPGILRIEEIIEKPSPDEIRSNLATIGRYILTPGIFPSLRRTAVGRSGELQLTDGIRDLLKSEDVHGILYPGTRYDVGDRIGWLYANLEIALQRRDLREGLIARILSLAKELRSRH